jgi:hypothetical protein
VLVKQLVKIRNATDMHYEVASFNGFNPSAFGFGSQASFGACAFA